MATYELKKLIRPIGEKYQGANLKITDGSRPPITQMRVELTKLEMFSVDDDSSEPIGGVIVRKGQTELIPTYYVVSVVGNPRKYGHYGALEGIWDGVPVEALPLSEDEEVVDADHGDVIWWDLRVKGEHPENRRRLVVCQADLSIPIRARFNIEIN